MTRPTLTITPADALIDVSRRILIENLSPGRTVEVSTLTRRAQADWRSQATFTADAEGQIDLERDAPIAGTYAGVSAMGLLWSQTPLDTRTRELFNEPVTAPLRTHVLARIQNGPELRADMTQRLSGSSVTRREVREDGLVGTLYLPAGAGPHPAVMILNGSGGGINEARAALYASHGYAAFALAYFKAPGLSDYISNTPLEYFHAGMDWIRRNVKPAHDFVALSGQSRGGELVLLLGATFPQAVSAVVAYVPGAVVHSGQNAADPKIGREGPTWLLGGKPLSHLWQDNRTASWKPFDEGPAPHRHEKAILTALQDPDAVARARIKVEDIQGPVMLLSGTDDGSWPSSIYARMVRDKLRDVAHPHAVQWLDYEGGGHAILFPYVPTTQLVYTHPVSGKVSTSGGNCKDNARADEQSWAGVLTFLADALAAARTTASTPTKESLVAPHPAPDSPDDLIDRLVGLAPDGATHAVRHQRDKVADATQGSYDALFDPALPGLALTERLLVALYASRLTPAPELVAHYRERLVAERAESAWITAVERGTAADVAAPRLRAILEFTRTLIERPIEGDKAALESLPAAGLSTPAIVTLSQLIAFLSYQVRLVAGLKAMKALENAA